MEDLVLPGFVGVRFKALREDLVFPGFVGAAMV